MATATFNPDLRDRVSQVRFNLGDTNVDQAQIEDVTIRALLDPAPPAPPKTPMRVAAICARALASKYASVADINVDDQLSKASKLYENYVQLAIRLERLADAEIATANTGTSDYSSIIVTGVGDQRGPLDYDPNYPPSWA